MHFNALAKIEAVAQKHDLTLAEIALRWISHHSLLKREYGDAVLIGASSVKHIEQVRILIYARGMREEENFDPGLYHRTWLTLRRGRFVSHLMLLGPLNVRADKKTCIAAEEVLKVLDEAWLEVSPYSANYFH